MEPDGHQLSSKTWGQTWVPVLLTHTAPSGPTTPVTPSTCPRFLICETETRGCFEE